MIERFHVKGFCGHAVGQPGQVNNKSALLITVMEYEKRRREIQNISALDDLLVAKKHSTKLGA